MGIWVDTDFGFDDLWALLLLRHKTCPIAGVSLVAGNTSLAQVSRNAMGARVAYGFDYSMWQGANGPLNRKADTAEHILGSTGMRSRGQQLPDCTSSPPKGAIEALRDWLLSDDGLPRTVLALGPLTNIAHLLQQWPDLAGRITRLVWMGGSAGRGNHTPAAEFNAVADAEALAVVLDADVAFDVVDLEFCRSVTFSASDMPETDTLTSDLLGGYLDIGLSRGRAGMAIYDPVAAMAIAEPGSMTFSPCKISVSTKSDESYGATLIEENGSSATRYATAAKADLAAICLAALEKEALHGARQ